MSRATGLAGALAAALAGAVHPAAAQTSPAAVPRDSARSAADSALPAAGRPVAHIVSIAWDNEVGRDAVGEADRVIALLDLVPGTRVADIGAGAGYYTTRLARRLAPRGTVYAQDIRQEILDSLGARVRREQLEGVTMVLGTPDDPRLPSGSVDVALLSHMYHEIARPYDFLYNLHRSLAPRARVAVIDSDKPTGSHGTPPALLRCEMAALGYRELAHHSLAPATGYLAVFARPDTLPRASSVVACSS
jgi:ubiquinone/menaquinone biosynthesis C-methylase UbiE